jgi:hypothetical protein
MIHAFMYNGRIQLMYVHTRTCMHTHATISDGDLYMRWRLGGPTTTRSCAHVRNSWCVCMYVCMYVYVCCGRAMATRSCAELFVNFYVCMYVCTHVVYTAGRAKGYSLVWALEHVYIYIYIHICIS